MGRNSRGRRGGGYAEIDVSRELKAFMKVLAELGGKSSFEIGYWGEPRAGPQAVISYEFIREPFWGTRRSEAHVKATVEREKKIQLPAPELLGLTHERGVLVGGYEEARVTGFPDRLVIEAKRGELRRIVTVSERGVETSVDAPPRF